MSTKTDYPTVTLSSGELLDIWIRRPGVVLPGMVWADVYEGSWWRMEAFHLEDDDEGVEIRSARIVGGEEELTARRERGDTGYGEVA